MQNKKWQALVFAFLTVVTLLALGIITSARAGGLANTTSLAGGVQGVWWDGVNAPGPDVEAVANGAMSLSPHISLVGAVAFGLTDSYLRSTVGARVTATDVDNEDFSIGLGIQYHNASVSELGPNEWCPDVSLGIRPWPRQAPAVTLTGLGWYGLESGRAGCAVGAKWRFDL